MSSASFQNDAPVAAAYERSAGTRWLGRPVRWCATTDSTNTRAVAAARTGELGHGAAVIAGRQTSGRGVGNNAWVSDRPDGLWCSLVLVDPPSVATLPLMAGVAVARALRERWGVDAHLKWPNDVLVGGRKIAGILAESVRFAGGAERVVVLGIGFNANQTDFRGELADTAVSLRQLIGRPVEIPSVFALVVQELERLLDDGVDARAAWLPMTRMVGRTLRVRHRDGEHEVTVVDVDADGGLVVRDASGVQRTLRSRGEIDGR